MMVVIFVASSVQDVGPLPGGLSDKSWHSAGYAVLGALMLRGLAAARWSRVTVLRAAAAVVLSTLYGVSDEWHQSFVPGRSPDVLDVAADAVGSTIGALAVLAAAAAVRRWGIVDRWPRPGRPE
jgi:VanZ family protein